MPRASACAFALLVAGCSADKSSDTGATSCVHSPYTGLEPARRALLLHVDELLDEIAFGTVVIVLQDGKVIQIETSEKIRLR